MKSKSFVEYGILPKIQNRWKVNRGEGERKLRVMSCLKRPRAYSEINREFEIERSNKILLSKLIHIANRKTGYLSSDVSFAKRVVGSEKSKSNERNITENFSFIHRLSPTRPILKQRLPMHSSTSTSKRKNFIRANIKTNLPSLISKRVLNPDPKPKSTTKIEPDFTLEDDSSIDEAPQQD